MTTPAEDGHQAGGMLSDVTDATPGEIRATTVIATIVGGTVAY